MLKAILFDLDQTLIDFMLMKKKSCEAAINVMIKAGLKLNKSKAMKILFELYDEFGIEDHKIFQKFLVRVNGNVDWKILSYGVVAYRKARQDYLKPCPGTKKTLAKLEKKYKLALVSDAPKIKVWLRLASIDIVEYFDVVITFDDTYSLKHQFFPYEMALKALKVKPEECLMVGDNPERDITGAKKLGMKTCLATYSYLWSKDTAKKAKPDFTIKKIEELLKVVENAN